jgi:hypothetical protein
MATQKKKTKEQRKARRKVMEKPTDAMRVRHIKELKEKNKDLEIAKLEREVRIAALEAVLSPIVWQSNRFAITMKSALPDQTVKLTHRVQFLRKVREVLANNRPKPQEEDYPDFHETARHTIEDLGNELLVVGVLAEEMQIAYEAGYEHRRAQELARLKGRKVDGE